MSLRKLTAWGVASLYLAGCSTVLPASAPGNAGAGSGLERVDAGGFQLKSPRFSLSGSDAGQGAQEVLPIVTRIPVPRFDIKPSDEVVDSMLADGKSHRVMVLFDDHAKVRVKKTGKIKSLSGIALAAHDEGHEDFQALEGVLKRFKIKSYGAHLGAEKKTDAELEAREKKLEAKAGGADLPNDGSWATISLDGYTKDEAKTLIKALNGLKVVKVAEPVVDDTPAHPEYAMTPSDPYFPSQSSWEANDYSYTTAPTKYDDYGKVCNTWYFNRHSFPGAWSYSRGAGVRVAVIDTSFQTDDHDGINYNGVLKKSFWYSFWTVWNDTNVKPNSDFDTYRKIHGSGVAHIIGGEENNGKGVSGVAPSVDLVPIKYDMTPEALAASIKYAYETGAEVINISTVPTPGQQSGVYTQEDRTNVRSELFNAWLNNVSVVLAAGNNNLDLQYNPNTYTGAIMVGGIDKTNQYWYAGSQGTNHGTRVDIAAAASYFTAGGVNDEGTAYRTREFGGTSGAAPLVAGAAAILRSILDDPQAVRSYLIFTADTARGYNASNPSYPRQLSSGYDGTDGVYKIRVLNAMSAMRVASNYQASASVQTYMPGASDRAVISTSSTIVAQGAYPAGTSFFANNIYYHWALPASFYTWVRNEDGGAWAGSTSNFRARYAYSYSMRGVPELRMATSQILVPAYNPSGDQVSNTERLITSFSVN